MVFEDVFEPLSLGFPDVSLENFSLFPPESRISVWTVLPQVCDFWSGSWSDTGDVPEEIWSVFVCVLVIRVVDCPTMLRTGVDDFV